MAKINLSDLSTTLSNSAAALVNANNAGLEAAFENTLSRDGTGPNQMLADIDLNNNDLNNVGIVNTGSLVLNGVTVAPSDLAALPATVMLKTTYDPQGKITDAFESNNHDFLQSGTGAVERSVRSKLRDVISVKDFGAVGDASTDDTAKIVAADAAAKLLGKPLFFPAGVYRMTNGITRTAHWMGEVAPQLAPFPLTGDDKQYLRPGSKHQIPGSVLLFTGTGGATATTQRSDTFSSFTYCIRTATTGLWMKSIGIVLDVNVYDAGGTLTAFGTDSSAVYDVGNYIDDVAQCLFEDVVTFGYFGKAGTVVRSVLGNDDPDYTIFRGGSTTGWKGHVLIGSESNDGFDSGLSGTQHYGYDIFSSADHHSRGAGTAAAIYAGAATARGLYIDGFTDASVDDINGHYFFGGQIRTYVDNAVEFDACSNAKFSGTVHETPKWGVPNSTTTQFLASASTNDITYINARFSDNAGLSNAAFAGTMVGQLTIIGCRGLGFGGMLVAEQTGGTVYWVKVGGASGGAGDPAIQLGDGGFNSSTTGWSLRRDVDASDILDLRWGGSTVLHVTTTGALSRVVLLEQARTIASDAITISSSYVNVDTEAAAATDNLATISGGVTGQLLTVRAANSSRDVVLTEAGNIRLNAAGNFTLDNSQDRITLQFDGTNWVEISRSDNTA